jgi:hypothetical protein
MHYVLAYSRDISKEREGAVPLTFRFWKEWNQKILYGGVKVRTEVKLIFDRAKYILVNIFSPINYHPITIYPHQLPTLSARDGLIVQFNDLDLQKGVLVMKG